MIEKQKLPQLDRISQTTTPPDTSQSVKEPWFDLLPKVLGIIVMILALSEIISLVMRHRFWF